MSQLQLSRDREAPFFDNGGEIAGSIPWLEPDLHVVTFDQS